MNLLIMKHHEVFDRAYHVSIYAKCRSTPDTNPLSINAV